MSGIKVGAAAAAVGISPKAIRLWEAKGLIPASARTDAGYRVFAEADLARLRFIRQAKTLGLTLSEIKSILDLDDAGARPCRHVATLLDAHIAAIDRTLAELQHLRAALTGVRDHAGELATDGNSMVCPVIERATASAMTLRRVRDREDHA